MPMFVAITFLAALVSQQVPNPAIADANSHQAATSIDTTGAREQLLNGQRIINDVLNSSKVGADRNGMLQSAIAPLRHTLTSGNRQQQVEALTALAFVYSLDLLDQPIDEEAAVAQLVELASDDVGARLRLAELQERLKDLDRAEQTLRQAKADFPDDGRKTNRALSQFFYRRAIDAERNTTALALRAGTGVRADEPARLLIGEMPTAPSISADSPTTVVVEAMISAVGKVVAVNVLQSVPSLDSTAIAAVTRWMFAPAIEAGRPVPSKITIPVVFKKSER